MTQVVILAAGSGTRLGNLAKNIHKGLLPVNGKPVISHIFEKFPKGTEIIVAVGHLSNTITDYLKIAHSDRPIKIVHVDKYIGPGTGPGYSLLQCKDLIKGPFVFSAVDTILIEDIPINFARNWIGVAPVKKTEEYCTVKMKNNLICQIDDKVKCDNKFAFIGVAGIFNYKEFFEALEKDKELKNGEIQVSNGLKKMIEYKMEPIGVTWFDTGNLENYTETNNNFSGNKNFDLSKSDEFIYFVGDKVIKFFADKSITENRVRRSLLLKGLCPTISDHLGNYYAYKRVDGQVLYDTLNTQILNDFLQWAKNNLWKRRLITSEVKVFTQACKDFYFIKTERRAEAFLAKKGIEDTENIINGVTVPKLFRMYDDIDWESLYDGVPVNFHGDLQFDNVIVSRDTKSNLQKFTLIDWRQDFAGLDYGDLYYDLGKLYGGMTISYKLIKEGKFTFDISGNSVYYNYQLSNDLIEAREEFEDFVKRNGYDMRKIKILRALIFINMSALLNDPFNSLVYYKGKLLLYKAINEAKK